MKRLVEIACASRHNGKGSMVEVFVISSDHASITLIRKGGMRRRGIDTKLDDIQRQLHVGRGHYDAAMAYSQRLIQEHGRTHTEQFGDDEHSQGYFLRYPQVADLNEPGVGFAFQSAVLFLFNEAIWHHLMWDLFPDMTEDANFAEAAMVNVEVQMKNYSTWGAW